MPTSTSRRSCMSAGSAMSPISTAPSAVTSAPRLPTSVKRQGRRGARAKSETRHRLSVDHRDAIDLDVERPGPFRNADEDARRRILREVAPVDGIDCRKMAGRGAEDVALHHVVERGAGGLQTALHLLENELGLALDRHPQDFAGFRIERRQSGDEDHVAGARHRRPWRCAPLLEMRGDRLDAEHLSFHEEHLRWTDRCANPSACQYGHASKMIEVLCPGQTT